MADRYRIDVDPRACIGARRCVEVAPKHFRMDATAIAHPVEEVTDADEAVLEAARSCPTDAITVTDAGTGEPVV